jgi:hypothetical protein
MADQIAHRPPGATGDARAGVRAGGYLAQPPEISLEAISQSLTLHAASLAQGSDSPGRERSRTGRADRNRGLCWPEPGPVLPGDRGLYRPGMDSASYLAYLRRELGAFEACLAGDLAAPVRHCGQWTLHDLADHLGRGNLWTAAAVTDQRGDYEAPAAPRDRVARAGWFRRWPPTGSPRSWRS